MRRRGPAGRVRGHRMTGGTPKEVHWTAEQQKRPQRTYRYQGENAEKRPRKGSATTGPKMSCLSTPPKIRLRGAGADSSQFGITGVTLYLGGIF